MSVVHIPEWNSQGVIPPIDEVHPVGANRSPYKVSLMELATKFSSSAERSLIIKGFLNYRAALHSLGFTNGFQWIDGSFTENVEILEGRTPRDMDVVTFAYASDKHNDALVKENIHLFIPAETKKLYHVDAYYVILNLNSPEAIVDRAAYWHGLLSHRRNNIWKGHLGLIQ